MTCYNPLEAYQTAQGDIVFQERARHDTVRSLFLSCGQCIGCRLERSRQWATRCLHEAQMHEQNAFVTLTYDNEHLPKNKNLQYQDFQNFIKRLRRQLTCFDVTLALHVPRYFAAGEYGAKEQRPHFHACLFGVDFNDKQIFKKNGSNGTLYTSARLEKMWPLGHSTTGAVTFQSAAYVARYIVEKINGDPAEEHYRQVDEATGEITYRTPEMAHMSLKPGIGFPWLKQFASDIYPEGLVVTNGKETYPPKYYDRWFKKQNSDQFENLQMERQEKLKEKWKDRTTERLKVRQKVAEENNKRLKRNLI